MCVWRVGGDVCVEGWVEMCVWKGGWGCVCVQKVWMWGELGKLNVCSKLKQQPALIGSGVFVPLGRIYTVTIPAKITVQITV